MEGGGAVCFLYFDGDFKIRNFVILGSQKNFQEK